MIKVLRRYEHDQLNIKLPKKEYIFLALTDNESF